MKLHKFSKTLRHGNLWIMFHSPHYLSIEHTEGDIVWTYINYKSRVGDIHVAVTSPKFLVLCSLFIGVICWSLYTIFKYA